MQPASLPEISRPAITVALLLLAFCAWLLASYGQASILLLLLAFLVSGFLSDAFTGLAHFCFDYVFPHDLPVLGPIAKEFQDHHEEPTLDPSLYRQNFTKGAYASIPASLLTIVLWLALPETALSFFCIAIVACISAWAFFFHQLHSYAHMGSHLAPDLFLVRIAEIGRLPSKRDQHRELKALFADVPIPPLVRLLQRCRLILSPERHNLHHTHFEADFSSVNGWSDPLLNIFLKPLARRYKARQAVV